MRICDNCHAVFSDLELPVESTHAFQTPVCPRCLSRKSHLPFPDDICLLAVLNGVNASIAEDLLSQAEIPYKTRSDFASITGQFGASVRFFTTYDQLSAANECLHEVFDQLL
ncbi:MAG: hypothetical protein IJ708_04335 [Clostridia bacterium]|nr:hypothetical protein [Clostridia bacterium]